jgi:hypothetical protein
MNSQTAPSHRSLKKKTLALIWKLGVASLLPLGFTCLGASAFNFAPATALAKPSIEIPRKDPFNFTTSFTLETWVRVSQFNTNGQAILTKGDSAWGLVRFENTEKVSFRTFNGVTMSELPSKTDFKPNEWHHIAAVYDGARKLLYVDGNLEASISYTSPVATNDYPVLIGRNAQNSGRNFNGAIDVVRLWSIPRTAEDIRSTTNHFLRGSEAGLVGCWDFEQVASTAGGTTTPDSGVNGLNGMLTELTSANQVTGITMLPPLSGNYALFSHNTDLSGKTAVVINGNPALRFQGQFTFECWINIQSFTGDSDYSIIAGSSGSWYIRYANASDTQGLLNLLTVKNGVYSDFKSTTKLRAHEWHHIGVVMNGPKRQIFIDGVLDSTTETSGLELYTTDSMTLGMGEAQPLNAILDEVRVWNRARTAEQIKENKDRTLNGNEPGLAVWFDFDEQPGTVIDKRAFDAHNGETTSIISTKSWVDGILLQPAGSALYSLYFNGTSDYVSIPQPSNPALLKFTNLTIEAWIRPQANPTATYKNNGFRNIAVKQDNGYGIALDNTNALCFWIGAGNPGLLVKSGFVVTNEVWQHVAVVVDTVKNQTSFYINGVSNPVTDVVPGIALIKNETGPLILGRQGSAQANYYKGWLAELRLWHAARSAEEIKLLYANPLPSGSQGLGGYWDFSDGLGTKLTDRSGLNINGTLNMSGAAWDYSAEFDVLPLPPGLNLMKYPLAAGLWVGQVTISAVSEVQTAIRKETKVTPTADQASVRILVHVDSAGTPRLLKDVTLMQREASGQNPASIVLVTDPRQLAQFKGIARRNGKWVGKRFTAAAYDFAGEALELAGGVGPGVGCKGTIVLSDDAPTNPFRHKYNPKLQAGYKITRDISLTFPTSPPGTFTSGSNDAVDTLSGAFQETITGLHKIPLVCAGTVKLTRIALTGTLNE